MDEFLFKFLKITGTFISIISIVFIFNFLAIKWIYFPEFEGSNIILGDSHAKLGIKPGLLSSRTQNLAQSGEPIKMSFYKLKEVIRHKKIDTVYFNLSPHNISSFNDLKLKNERWSKEMFRRYYSFIFSNKMEITMMEFLAGKITIFKNMCLFPKIKHNNFFGGFEESNKNDLSDTISAIKRHYFFNKKKQSISNIQIRYFDSIVSFSSRNNIKLIVCGSPVHEIYFNSIPDAFIIKYKDLMNDNDKYISIDLTNLNLKDENFRDLDHLNSTGATIYTTRIKEYLKNKTL